MATELGGYSRVNLQQLDAAVGDDAPASPSPTPAGVSPRLDKRSAIRWFILPLSLLLCLVQAMITVVAENARNINITSTLISVVSFAVLFGLVVVVNPLLQLVFRGRFLRPLNRAELVSVFAAMIVTAGVSTFGLASQLVPIVAAPWNQEWNTPQRGWDRNLLPHLNQNLYITDTEAIRVFRQRVDVPQPPDTASWATWWEYHKAVAKAIPWSTWIEPLAYWLIFVFAFYAAFYFLAYIVLDYWDNREKLIFPLAKLSESLLPESDADAGRLPAIFRTSGFWIGFALPVCVLAWNASISVGWTSGLDPIALGMSSFSVDKVLRNSVFEGLTGGPFTLMFLVIFTAVGLAFLLPLETSLSIWFYFVMAKLFFLVMVWMGYGRTGADFPTDWLWVNNAVTAQGAGGILLFASISLYRSLRDYVELVRGNSLTERIKVGLPVVGLAIALLIIVGWLRWNQISLIWAVVLVLFLTLTTLGLMRIVAEGGVYWFQSHGSFFHFYKMTGAGGLLLGPLLPIYSVLFLDIKTFMAPNLLNAAKSRQEVQAERFKFHANIVICLVVTVIFSLGLAVFLAHERGAQQMQRWFYSSGPALTLDTATQAMTRVPAVEPTTMGWYTLGAGWVGVSMFIRRTIFWFPHPIGYLMLINPLMSSLWFSFFLGWLSKSFVVKYGGKRTFDSVRTIFIGMIIGELFSVFAWSMMALIYNISVGGITLNRMGS